MKYELTNDGVLEIVTGVVQQRFSVNLKDETFIVSEGMLFLGGLQYLMYLFMGMCIAVSGTIRNIGHEVLYVFIPFAIMAIGFIWYRWGIFARGTTVKFKNGEKLFVYCGSNEETYCEIIRKIHKLNLDKSSNPALTGSA